MPFRLSLSIVWIRRRESRAISHRTEINSRKQVLWGTKQWVMDRKADQLDLRNLARRRGTLVASSAGNSRSTVTKIRHRTSSIQVSERIRWTRQGRSASQTWYVVGPRYPSRAPSSTVAACAQPLRPHQGWQQRQPLTASSSPWAQTQLDWPEGRQMAAVWTPITKVNKLS